MGENAAQQSPQKAPVCSSVLLKNELPTLGRKVHAQMVINQQAHLCQSKCLLLLTGGHGRTRRIQRRDPALILRLGQSRPVIKLTRPWDLSNHHTLRERYPGLKDR